MNFVQYSSCHGNQYGPHRRQSQQKGEGSLLTQWGFVGVSSPVVSFRRKEAKYTGLSTGCRLALAQVVATAVVRYFRSTMGSFCMIGVCCRMCCRICSKSKRASGKADVPSLLIGSAGVSHALHSHPRSTKKAAAVAVAAVQQQQQQRQQRAFFSPTQSLFSSLVRSHSPNFPKLPKTFQSGWSWLV
jgi:hypothetical protein